MEEVWCKRLEGVHVEGVCVEWVYMWRVHVWSGCVEGEGVCAEKVEDYVVCPVPL